MPVHVGFAGGRGHQRHIVERGDEDAPVHRVQVEVALQGGVRRQVRLGAGARRVRLEAVFRPAAELGDMPAHPALQQHVFHAPAEPAGQRDHLRVGVSGQHRGPRVARIAARDSALPASVPPMPPVSSRSASAWASMRSAVPADRPSAPQATPCRWPCPWSPCPGAGPTRRCSRPDRGHGVRLVDDQQRPGGLGQLAERLVIAGLRQDDAHVGHGRRREHARHGAPGQRLLHRGQDCS